MKIFLGIASQRGEQLYAPAMYLSCTQWSPQPALLVICLGCRPLLFPAALRAGGASVSFVDCATMDGEHTRRRLAAILASDVVGFSAMMAQDEGQTLRRLKTHRETVFDPAVARWNGRIVKLMGDGALVEFLSVVDAVDCALEIQSTIEGLGSDNIALRIGVNLGDVIVDGDDIYGNGVNIAARLEPLAETGGVCVSSIVKESISARPGVEFTDGGEVQVKNIERPIRTWHWHPSRSARSGGSDHLKTASEPKGQKVSLAVLPFENRSGDPEQEYFSEGIAEDIITDLSKVSGLLVIARNSSFAYKGKGADLATVGRDLGVGKVLEGSVRKAGSRVRITAQLVEISSGAQLWAERYDRELTDIFEVQDEVTLNIVDALKVQLRAGEEALITGPTTQNVAAHDLILRARAFVHAPIHNADVNKRVNDLSNQAIEIDPNYSKAYSMRAFGHLFNYYNGWTGDRQTALDNAKEDAVRAMELDGNDPMAIQAVAATKRPEGKFAEGKALFDKALAIDPNFAGAYLGRGINHVYLGQPEQAIIDLEKGRRLDPAFSQHSLHFLGMSHMFLGNFETAELMFRERLLQARDTDIGRALLASVLGHLGNKAEARQYWDELIELHPGYQIHEHLARLPFQVDADKQVILDGLRKAELLDG